MTAIQVIWNLWKERNLQVFEKKTTLPHIATDLIFQQAKECAEVMELDLSPDERRSKAQKPWLTWLPPFADDIIKINTDASRRNKDGMTAIAGVLRNHKGECIKGFIGCTGVTNIHIAEMRAIREALFLAKELNFNKLELESDSETAIHVLHGDNEVLSEEYSLVKDCRELINLDSWEVRATFQRREKNKLADAMAKLGFQVNSPIMLLDNPPEEVKNLYVEDKIIAARFLI